jgi:hypothetical protein
VRADERRAIVVRGSLDAHRPSGRLLPLALTRPAPLTTTQKSDQEDRRLLVRAAPRGQRILNEQAARFEWERETQAVVDHHASRLALAAWRFNVLGA